jgi:tRNA (guanine26-N2/guanine27-N2)-dimethyltransferase
MRKNDPITEGLATVLPIETNEVFYNPAQVFNRDLSILAISEFASKHKKKEGEPVRVFEGLAASGLRSIRYVKELKGASFEVTANDIEKIAVERMERNATHNGLVTGHDIFLTNEDAIQHLHINKNKYDVIDLDPYGSCSMFLDSAVACVAPNGLLCVTSTDGGVLCGNQPDMAYIRYGGFALKKDYCHEMGLRVMLHAIASAAARHKRGIKVLAALSIDFYFRAFIQIIEKPDLALESMLNTGLVLQCVNCDFHRIHSMGRREGPNRKPNRLGVDSVCPECDSAISVGGPMYLGALHDETFSSELLDPKIDDFPGITSWAKIKALMNGLHSELPDVPLFYSLRSMSGCVKVSPPKLRVFKLFLQQLGYRVGGSHRTPNVFKTDAPHSVVFDLLRLYVESTGAKKKEDNKLLQKNITTEIPESLNLDWNMKIDDKNEPSIFLPNPTPFWGPKQRAVASEGNSAKRLKLKE